ncbi:hypothetical protein PRK78_003866 [Emydomyces testavorans]|uniref:Uncharacterized protein n=1 Tax=Emydomyces testavorans TaxID=2070801 RepID=A0AAF0DHK9_9EURO|nr:hypothetical protein PRK78_003866 [Emydomyces testavorans]
MNWTGGRLSRHSFKDKHTRRAREKLHFAKVRRLASRNRKEDLSPIRIPRSTPDVVEISGAPLIRHGNKKNGESGFRNADKNQYLQKKDNLRDGWKRPGQQTSIGNSNKVSSDGNTLGSLKLPAENLEDIRRKLLQKSDWAHLSASRPLNLHFITEEERYNYGRRRPLTQADQKRLAAPEKRRAPVFQSYQWSSKRRKRGEPRDDASTQPNLDDISIRIDEQKLASLTPRLRSDSQVMSQISSEPMLLDREEGNEGNIKRSTSIFAKLRSNGTVNIFGTPDNGFSTPCDFGGSQRKQTPTCPTVFKQSDLPMLNRHGAFTTHGHQTMYIPPGLEDVTVLDASEYSNPTGLSPHIPVLGDKSRMERPVNTQEASSYDPGAKISKKNKLGTPIEAHSHPIPSESPRRATFFGQTIEESPKDFPSADEIWKRLIFKPRDDNIDRREELGPSFFMEKEAGDIKDISSLHEADTLGNIITNDSLTDMETFPTAANTSLNWTPSSKNCRMVPSETDFLSQFSPMGGYIDEFLGDMSMHNNATKTNKSVHLSSPETRFRDWHGFRHMEHIDEAPCSDFAWSSDPPAQSVRDPRSLGMNVPASPQSFASRSINNPGY